VLVKFNVKRLLLTFTLRFDAEYWGKNKPNLETFLRYRKRMTRPDEQLKKETEHFNYIKDLETICEFYTYQKYRKARNNYKVV
jgi:hypothetical protein